MRLAAALCAVWLVCVAPAHERPQDQLPPIFRAGVDVVQLEVSILDHARRPVHGLTRQDVQVFEDRESQEVVDVQEIRLNVAPPPAAWSRAPADVATNDVADRRLLAIVMDDLHCCALPAGPASPDLSASDHWAIDNAVANAHRLIDSLGPRDLATVALTHEQAAAQRFTADRDALHAVVARFAPITETGCLPASPVRSPEADLAHLLAMSPHPVKAMVVFMSPVRIDARNIPRCPQAVSSTPAPETARLEMPGLPAVPVYKLNVSGLLTDPALRRQNGPNRTGGRNFYSANDLEPAVEDLLAENDAYYLIGFRTSRPTVDGKYRQLNIKVARSGEYTVRTRPGYLRPGPPPKPGSRADRERQRPPGTVAVLLPDADVTMNATVASFAMPGSHDAMLLTTIELAHPIVEWPASAPDELDLRTVAYASSGGAKYDVHSKTSSVLSTDARVVSTAFSSRLAVAPDRYELWLTAHDARTNRSGGVFYNIDVPDFAVHPVSLSGVVLGRHPAQGTPLPPVLAGLVPIVPTASRQFGPSESISAFVQVYQGRDTPLAPVTLTWRVLDEHGGAKFDASDALGAERFAESHAVDDLLRLPLDRLAAGRYLLTIEAHVADRIARKRDVPFSVR